MLDFCCRQNTSFEILNKNSLATFQKRKENVLLRSSYNPYVSGKLNGWTATSHEGNTYCFPHCYWKVEGRIKIKTFILPDKSGLAHMKAVLKWDTSSCFTFRSRSRVLLRESFWFQKDAFWWRLSNIQTKPPLAQPETISSCPIAGYLGESNPHVAMSSSQAVLESNNVSPELPFLWAEQPHILQLLLIRHLLQTLH